MRKNNFDFLRILFALFVVITHSYTLSANVNCDWLCSLTNGNVNFSYIGVKAFFVISGYLIYQSAQRSTSFLDFFKKRVLRIFPALLVVLILTCLALPFVYESSVPLFSNSSYLSYLPNNMSLFNVQMLVEGVFENNPYPSTINGCLWTLRYEFLFYILTSFLILLHNKPKTSSFLILAAFSVLLFVRIFHFDQASIYGFYTIQGSHFIDLSLFYSAGALIASFRLVKPNSSSHILNIALILLPFSLYFADILFLHYLLLPIGVIYIGEHSTKYLKNIGHKLGDLSYGIYIYGFPIQQLLMYNFKLNIFELFISSVTVTIIAAYLSWHLIEKQALKLKQL